MLELFRKLTRGLGKTFTGTAEMNYQKGMWGIKEICVFINMASFDTPLILLDIFYNICTYVIVGLELTKK